MKKQTVKINVYYNNSEIPSYVRSQILDLCDKSYCKLASNYRKLEVGWSLNLSNINESFTEEDGFYITAEIGRNENTKVIGFIHYTDDDSQEYHPSATWIQNVWVEPEYRRTGIASKLVRKLINEIRLGNQFFINVMSNDYSSFRFWDSLGFNNPIYSVIHLNSNEGSIDETNYASLCER